MRVNAVCAVVMAGLATVASGQNLLVNGSFESTLPPFLGGGFTSWNRFNNFFADESVETPAFEGLVSAKSFGEFLGTGRQSDSGVFQDAPVTNAAGKTFRLSVQVRSNGVDFLQPADFSGPSNFGHLPLLIMDFKDANRTNITSVSVGAFDASVDAPDEWIERSVEGVAPAGTQFITAFLLMIQFGDAPGSLFWDDVQIVEVVAACVPDLNNDGVLNIFDIFAYFGLFGAGDAAADLTGDGSLNIFDIFEYFSLFGAGCP